MNWNLWLDRYLMPIDDAGSRFFYLNILMAFGFLLFWLVWKNPRKNWLRQIWSLVGRRKYWWNASARLDYKIYILNSAFKVVLFIPFLDFSYQIASWTAKGLEAGWGDFLGLSPRPESLLVFTLITFIWDDGLRFLQHFMSHKFSFLWRFHALHHSAKVLTPMTLFRSHPVESAISTLRNGLSLGVAMGFFIFIFESHFTLVTLFGVNLFGFLFNLAGSNLRHSHIPISFGDHLECLFISPKQHQIHHSRAADHQNRNFGVSLSLWDSFAGTLMRSSEVNQPIRVGIAGRGHATLWKQLTRL